MSLVTLIHTSDRVRGVAASIKDLGINPANGKNVLIKPNFNTADPTPGSTHNDTLMALIDVLWTMGAKSISLGERSYPPTRKVMEQKGIIPLLKQKEVRIIDFDDLERRDWVEFKPRGSHWPNGFRIARPILETDCLISTCCLKTHQFGGIFSMSLKLHVGAVPTSRNGFDYMSQLHQSTHQCKMIAEINEPFEPQLVVMDAVDVFVDGGPMTGKRARADAVLAATDRVAIDAVGVAILKFLGSNDDIMKRSIFGQEQIARAIELGLGSPSPSAIEIRAVDQESERYCASLRELLARG